MYLIIKHTGKELFGKRGNITRTTFFK